MGASVEIIVRYRDSSAGDRKKTAEGIKGIGDEADKSKGKLNAFGEMAVGALRKVGDMAVGALADAGRAVVSFVGESIKGAGDYEQSMNVFQEQSKATDEQMQAVKETAKELGADMTLPATSAADAGTAMLELSKAGLEVEESMAAAKGTLQLAAAAQTDTATAANITAGALNTFHLEGDQAVRVADMLASTANASSASITDLADGVKQGGFAFYAAGQGLDDLNASLGILTNVGLTGSDSGTALKNALMRLMDPTKEAAGLMKNLGINAYDSQGKMLPMRDLIGHLNDKLSGMNQQQRNAALGTIFLSDGMKAMIPLLDAGVEGYDEMKEKVNQSGTAAGLAGAQMKGLNGVIAGVQSVVETLMLEGLEPLLPLMTSVIGQVGTFASGLQGQVGPAVENTISFLGVVINLIQSGAIPALGGVTTALIAYATVQLVQATPAIIASLPVIAAQTGAFVANATAVAAAVAPYALIALAVAGVVKAYQDLNTKITENAQSVLAGLPDWQASAAAMESYGNAAATSKEQLAPYANTISALRTQIQGEVEDLGRRMTLGQVSDQQYQIEIQRINEHRSGLEQATNAYNAQEQALLRQQAAAATGTNAMNQLKEGEQQVMQQTQLTQEEFDKLEKKIEETFQKGAEAVSSYVSTEVEFLNSLHKQQKEGYDKNLEAQALAYAQEQAAQKAHLGQMLIDYTLTQVQMGNISRESAMAITAGIEKEFGVQKDTSARTFLEMTSHIDKFAASGSQDIDAISSDLGGLADDAVTTRMKMDELAKQYTATLVQNFKDGKITADQLADALNKIPSKVYSEVVINTTRYERTRQSDDDGVGGLGGRAIGGSVHGGTPYVVGERGREVMVPEQSGSVIPGSRVQWGGETNIYNLYYTGVAADQGNVDDALRTQQLLMG